MCCNTIEAQVFKDELGTEHPVIGPLWWSQWEAGIDTIANDGSDSCSYCNIDSTGGCGHVSMHHCTAH